MVKLSIMAAVQPSSPSSVDAITGGVMEHPAVASTHALLEAIQTPGSYHARVRLGSWRADATTLLADILKDRVRAVRVVEDLISGLGADDLEQESIAELREILDANIALARAHY